MKKQCKLMLQKPTRHRKLLLSTIRSNNNKLTEKLDLKFK